MAPLREKIVIIGSGFAGSVAASHLTAAGLDVTLLERGPWRDTLPVRRIGIKRRAPLPVGWCFYTHLLHRINGPSIPFGKITLNRRGVYEMHMGKNLDVACANQVGGGSHVYGGLNMRPASSSYWEGHHPGVTARSMEPHYQAVLRRMGSAKPLLQDRYPNMFPERMAAKGKFITDQRSLDMEMGIAVSPGMDEAAISSSGLLGSGDGTKRTVDEIFLREALAQGLQIRDMCEVAGIYREQQSDRTSYRVEYIDHQHRRTKQIVSDRLIMAAGTMNTLKLLLQSRDRHGGLDGMSNLGRHFGGNGDYSAYWHHEGEAGDLSVGLPVRGRVQLADTDHWRTARPWPMIVEGGLPYSAQLPWLPWIGRMVKRGTLLAGMGDDQMIGEVRSGRKGLRVDYDPADAPIYDDLHRAFALIESLSGQRLTHFPKVMTMHPIGGARLGSTPERGVVDDRGEVYGHPGLYIADGSVLPAALGVPPSMTIAAWASSVAQRMITDLTVKTGLEA